ncbi:Fip1 motif-domain-containing protein [Pilobolus umbonatus]|nr:Fip1 motif-domain-containing protein [Pilobolus umbonatus]
MIMNKAYQQTRSSQNISMTCFFTDVTANTFFQPSFVSRSLSLSLFIYTHSFFFLSFLFPPTTMSNNHLSDDDDEFLYGTSETAPMSNNPLNSRLDVDDLYELYDDMDTKDKETDMEEERIEDADKEKKVTEDTEETDTTVVEIQKAENTVENEEEEESDDDLEIILEPEEESHQEPETEQHNGDKSSTVENKDTPVNIKPGQQGKPSSTPTANASSQPTNTKTAQGGINLEAVGEYNGQQITEVDLDSVEDKPWRKPGADITDYFNYGFNENTWRSYCAKQKMLRDKKIMSDIDMGDFMSMGMMMPPNMMDGAMPMGMGGMPAPMMGLPMGLPNSVNNPAGSAGIRAVRNANFNPRGPGRSNMPMGRSKTSDKEREGDM